MCARCGRRSADRPVRLRRRPCSRLNDVDVGLSPSCDQIGHVSSVAASANQVIGVIERDEAFGMLRLRKDARGVVDPYGRVRRGVHDEQCFTHSSMIRRRALRLLAQHAQRVRERRHTVPCVRLSPPRHETSRHPASSSSWARSDRRDARAGFRPYVATEAERFDRCHDRRDLEELRSARKRRRCFEAAGDRSRVTPKAICGCWSMKITRSSRK